MKKIIYLVLLIGVHTAIFSQERVPDGIYLVGNAPRNNYVAQPAGIMLVSFNPFFVEGEPERYDPVAIVANEFVAFELTAMPVIQSQQPGENSILVHLSVTATEKLKEFMARNSLKKIAVVVNNEAIAIYKIVEPVASGFIKVSRCNDQGCIQVYNQLRNAVKS